MSGTSHLGKVLKVFYSYAHRDKKLRDELATHLSGLQRQGIITDWYDERSEPGASGIADQKASYPVRYYSALDQPRLYCIR